MVLAVLFNFVTVHTAGFSQVGPSRFELLPRFRFRTLGAEAIGGQRIFDQHPC